MAGVNFLEDGQQVQSIPGSYQEAAVMTHTSGHIMRVWRVIATSPFTQLKVDQSSLFLSSQPMHISGARAAHDWDPLMEPSSLDRRIGSRCEHSCLFGLIVS